MIKTPTPPAIKPGISKLRRKLSTEVLRHEKSGPTAVRNSSSSATGIITLLKNGGPTVILCPCTHSESTGNRVPQRTVKQATSNMRLLNKKLDSRETNASSRFSLRRCARLRTKKYVQTASVSARKAMNHVPIDDCANAWAELTTPLRFRNVPKIASIKVLKSRHMFQSFNMPRFSCIITECRNAVPVNHGRSDAFSTGSHPQ